MKTLRSLKAGLTRKGVLVLKENRPYLAKSDVRMFQCDTPAGENSRYDITRPDAHHIELFQRAGLEAEVLQGAPLQPPQPPLPVSLHCTALHCTGCIYLFCVAMQLSIRGDSARQFH